MGWKWRSQIAFSLHFTDLENSLFNTNVAFGLFDGKTHIHRHTIYCIQVSFEGENNESHKRSPYAQMKFKFTWFSRWNPFPEYCQCWLAKNTEDRTMPFLSLCRIMISFLVFLWFQCLRKIGGKFICACSKISSCFSSVP